MSELEIRNRRTMASARFQKMRESRATLVERGRFFEQLLTDGVWPTQRALAAGIGESVIQVSRCLKASRVPQAIARVFGERQISIRTATALDEIAQQIGKPKLLENARRLGVRNDLTIRSILTALHAGSIGSSGEQRNEQVRLVANRNENYLRLYSPNIGQLRKQLHMLEMHIELAMQLLSLR